MAGDMKIARYTAEVNEQRKDEPNSGYYVNKIKIKCFENQPNPNERKPKKRHHSSSEEQSSLSDDDSQRTLSIEEVSDDSIGLEFQLVQTDEVKNELKDSEIGMDDQLPDTSAELYSSPVPSTSGIVPMKVIRIKFSFISAKHCGVDF